MSFLGAQGKVEGLESNVLKQEELAKVGRSEAFWSRSHVRNGPT